MDTVREALQNFVAEMGPHATSCMQCCAPWNRALNKLRAALASQEAQSTGAPIHPQSLEGLVGESGGHYLTGGGAAFTSFALAKFVVLAVEHAAQPPHDMSREAGAPSVIATQAPASMGTVCTADVMRAQEWQSAPRARERLLSWLKQLAGTPVSAEYLTNGMLQVDAKAALDFLVPPQPADKP